VDAGSDDGTWVEIQIETTAEASELVAATVAPLTGGVELRDGDTLLSTAASRTGVVALCRPDRVDEVLAEVEAVLAAARAAGTAVDPVSIRQRQAHEDEWRDVWKQFFRATRVGRRFVVRPSWDPGVPPPGEHVIDLDPGRAFGTGAHPSTRLVIGLLEDIAEGSGSVQRFLDLGTGSGILAIVAARLWPGARGLAVDVDPEATECAAENLARNRVASVELRTGALEVAAGDGPFAVVVANIQAEVLEPLAPALAAVIAAGGSLVLSGLLVEQGAAVEAAYRAAGLDVEARAVDGEWTALWLVRGAGR
jgi:ribosomal protein L11 methyltransferase